MNSGSFPRVLKTENRLKPRTSGYLWEIHGRVIDRKLLLKLSSVAIRSMFNQTMDLFRSDGFRIKWLKELLTIRLYLDIR